MKKWLVRIGDVLGRIVLIAFAFALMYVLDKSGVLTDENMLLLMVVMSSH